MSEKNENFPSGFQALLLVIALWLVQIPISATLYGAGDVLGLGSADQGWLTMVAANGVVFTWVMHYKALDYADLFHRSSTSAKMTLLLVLPPLALTVPALVMLNVTLVNFAVALFPLSASEEALFSLYGNNAFSTLIATCLLAPVLEEMLFRGIMLRGFLRQYSRFGAIVGSALLFGLAHMNLYQFIAATILGLFLGWLYERTRSLWPCIALHAAYNTACAIGTAFGTDPVSMLSWLMMVLAGVAGLAILRRMLRPASA